MEDLGSAVGISGPALYRHFPGKDALLTELLTDFSRQLLEGGLNANSLTELVDIHLEFALDNPDVIRIQDRDLPSMTPESARAVRRTQRQYVELWVMKIRATNTELSESEARTRAHAVFGLLNSTPHSARSVTASTRSTLRAMAIAALSA